MIFLIPLFAISAQAGPGIKLESLNEARVEDYKVIQTVRDRLLAADPFSNPTPNMILADPTIHSMGLDGELGSSQVQTALGYNFDHGTLGGYSPIDFDSKDSVLDATVARKDASGQPKFESLRAGFKDLPLALYQLKVVSNAGTEHGYLGLIDKPDLQSLIAASIAGQAKSPNKVTATIDESPVVPIQLYENQSKRVLVVLDKAPAWPLKLPAFPELFLFKNTPAEVDAAQKKRDATGIHMQTATWAVKTPEGIVDIEHLRRQTCYAIQKLRDDTLAKHPTSADFPPEMTQTPQFKEMGFDLTQTGDIAMFRQALSYKPEGQLLSGFHPIDAKDKAAGYSSVRTLDGTNFEVKTLQNAYPAGQTFVFKLHIESIDPKQKLPAQEAYIGPATRDMIANLQKQASTLKITEMKDQTIPVQIYTNGEGRIELVLAFKPKDLLLIPPPFGQIYSDPANELESAFAPPKNDKQKKDEEELQKKLHLVLQDFSFQAS